MSIKYHQNGIGPDYGEDHKLTDNWNPDADYGNEYVSVHFRINTPTYHYDSGFNTEESRSNWHTEISNLIRSLEIMEGCGYDYEKKKCAYLHAHPQDISGVILKSDVKKVAEEISRMTLSSIRWVDLYETVYDISDAEYEQYLNGRKEEIRKEIFKNAATTRTDKFVRAFDIARHLADKVRLHRLGLNDGKNYGGGQTSDYILKVADLMIQEGYLKPFEWNGEKYVRSLNKTEQKKAKLEFA